MRTQNVSQGNRAGHLELAKTCVGCVSVYFNIPEVCAVGNKTPGTTSTELKEITVYKQLKCELWAREVLISNGDMFDKQKLKDVIEYFKWILQLKEYLT